MTNNEITNEWIAQQRAVCDAATPGPWGWQVIDKLDSYLYGGNNAVAMSICAEESAFMFPKEKLMRVIRPNPDGRARGPMCIEHPNAIFIALSRTALPAALDALEASMQREAEKDAEISRLKIELSRPESYYLLNKIIDLTAERDAAVCDMFGCMSTQGQCVRCKKRYYCDGTDDDKFSPLCKNKSHCYAWEWRGLHAENALEVSK